MTMNLNQISSFIKLFEWSSTLKKEKGLLIVSWFKISKPSEDNFHRHLISLTNDSKVMITFGVINKSNKLIPTYYFQFSSS